MKMVAKSLSVNERVNIFLRKNSLKFVHDEVYFSQFFVQFFFKSCSIIFKRKANSTIEQQKCKFCKKTERLLISKLVLFLDFPAE